MEIKKEFNYQCFALDLLVKGSLFIWLYRWFGIKELVSFPTLFLAIGIELGVLLVLSIISIIVAALVFKNIKKQADEYLDNEYELIDE